MDVLGLYVLTIATSAQYLYRLPNTLQKDDTEIMVVTKVPLIETTLYSALSFQVNNLKKYSCLFKEDIFLFGRILSSHSLCIIWS